MNINMNSTLCENFSNIARKYIVDEIVILKTFQINSVFVNIEQLFKSFPLFLCSNKYSSIIRNYFQYL